MLNLIGDIWRGQTYSLGKHYWLFLVLPLAPFKIIMRAEDNGLISPPPIVDFLILIIYVSIFIIGYVGLVRCVRREKWRGWGKVAFIFATLGLIFLSLGIMAGTVGGFNS